MAINGSSFLNRGMQTAFLIPNILQVTDDMHKARNENKSVAWAGASSAIRNNWQIILANMTPRPGLALAGMVALQLAPAIATATYGYYQSRNNWIRTISTPFSQRFDHSDWSRQSQMRGLESINGARSMLGAEASFFASRYTRR